MALLGWQDRIGYPNSVNFLTVTFISKGGVPSISYILLYNSYLCSPLYYSFLKFSFYSHSKFHYRNLLYRHILWCPLCALLSLFTLFIMLYTYSIIASYMNYYIIHVRFEQTQCLYFELKGLLGIGKRKILNRAFIFRRNHKTFFRELSLGFLFIYLFMFVFLSLLFMFLSLTLSFSHPLCPWKTTRP